MCVYVLLYIFVDTKMSAERLHVPKYMFICVCKCAPDMPMPACVTPYMLAHYKYDSLHEGTL